MVMGRHEAYIGDSKGVYMFILGRGPEGIWKKHE